MNLLSINELSSSFIEEIYNLTAELKKEPLKPLLKGKTAAMIFEKPSNRTRVSFEVGMFQLGGHAVSLSESMLQIGSRESEADVARTLSRYVDCIIYRTFEHSKVEEMAKYATVPVINALSDKAHPCQALADVYTIRERVKGQGARGKENDLRVVFVGDGNNVARSLNELCKKTGIKFLLCCPKGYEMEGCEISHDPKEAVKDADVIYTDVWASMGQEKETKKRKKDFAKFQVNMDLIRANGRSPQRNLPLVMHCLPAHRGDEITNEVIESPNSIVFDQAENRLHVQKAVLVKLLADRRPGGASVQD
ncbi:MAG: ornithine carbamoyltransferase [Candidatus Margulisiibacteriota bacterium]